MWNPICSKTFSRSRNSATPITLIICKIFEFDLLKNARYLWGRQNKRLDPLDQNYHHLLFQTFFVFLDFYPAHLDVFGKVCPYHGASRLPWNGLAPCGSEYRVLENKNLKSKFLVNFKLFLGYRKLVSTFSNFGIRNFGIGIIRRKPGNFP